MQQKEVPTHVHETGDQVNCYSTAIQLHCYRVKHKLHLMWYILMFVVKRGVEASKSKGFGMTKLQSLYPWF